MTAARLIKIIHHPFGHRLVRVGHGSCSVHYEHHILVIMESGFRNRADGRLDPAGCARQAHAVARLVPAAGLIRRAAAVEVPAPAAAGRDAGPPEPSR